MKKILFVSNITNKITNFSLPSILASKSLGYEFHLASNLTNFKDEPSKYGIKLHHIDFNRNPFNVKNIKAYRQMTDLIKQEGFDVIHCNTPIGGILGRLCGRRAKVPKVLYTVHGFHFYEGASIINRTLFKWVETWLSKYTDAIITLNIEDYHAAQKLPLRKGGNVYYSPGVGVDTMFIKLAEPKREDIIKEVNANKSSVLIISVGELNRNKNNVAIINALGKLQNNNIHYLLCGVGDQEAEIQLLAKENNIDKNVHFLGYRSDIPQLLKSCDVFVMPSYREGLSRSIMEAMSAGLPCIVSKIRGNVDLIEGGKGGFLCSPNDPNEFSVAISKLFEDMGLREEMGKFNLQRIKKFDTENVKKNVKEIYREEL